MKIPFANLENRFFHLLASAYEKHDKKQSYQISLLVVIISVRDK